MNYSPYFMALTRDHKDRYLEKISVIGEDPYAINIQLCVTDIEAFPPTVYPDIVMYLVHTKSAYTMEEMKAYKSLDAYNQAACGWVKKIAVKTFASHILVLGKVMHSQRLNEKLLSPWIITHKDGRIHSAHCDCIAGLGEVCTHVGAILFSLDETFRRKEETTRTGVKAYWMPPSNKPTEPSRTRNIDFSTAHKRFFDEPIFERTADDLNIPPLSKNEQFNLLKNLREVGGTALQLATEPFASEIHRDVGENERFYMMALYKEENESKPLDSLRHLGQQQQFTLSAEDCHNIENQTRSQSKCKSWFLYRAGRITASVFKKCCKTQVDKPSVSLIKHICYPKSYRIKALQYGCDHEKFAVQDFVKYMKKKHVKFTFSKCGFYIDPKQSYFGATPDGIVKCECCGEGILEIKCPYCIRFNSILNLSEKKYSFVRVHNGDLQIKEDHDYFYQVQMQLAITGHKYCYLVGWCKKDFAYAKVAFNEHFWLENSQIAKTFFFNVILPECLGKYYTRTRQIESSVEVENEEYVELGFYEELVYEDPNHSPKEVSLIEEHSHGSDTRPLSPQPGPSKIVYCICRGEDDKKRPMIACESKNCKIEWYHLDCVGLKAVPASIWICNTCSERSSFTDSD